MEQPNTKMSLNSQFGQNPVNKNKMSKPKKRKLAEVDKSRYPKVEPNSTVSSVVNKKLITRELDLASKKPKIENVRSENSASHSRNNSNNIMQFKSSNEKSGNTTEHGEPLSVSKRKRKHSPSVDISSVQCKIKKEGLNESHTHQKQPAQSGTVKEANFCTSFKRKLTKQEKKMQKKGFARTIGTDTQTEVNTNENLTNKASETLKKKRKKKKKKKGLASEFLAQDKQVAQFGAMEKSHVSESIEGKLSQQQKRKLMKIGFTRTIGTKIQTEVNTNANIPNQGTGTPYSVDKLETNLKKQKKKKKKKKGVANEAGTAESSHVSADFDKKLSNSTKIQTEVNTNANIRNQASGTPHSVDKLETNLKKQKKKKKKSVTNEALAQDQQISQTGTAERSHVSADFDKKLSKQQRRKKKGSANASPVHNQQVAQSETVKESNASASCKGKLSKSQKRKLKKKMRKFSLGIIGTEFNTNANVSNKASGIPGNVSKLETNLKKLKKKGLASESLAENRQGQSDTVKKAPFCTSFKGKLTKQEKKKLKKIKKKGLARTTGTEIQTEVDKNVSEPNQAYVTPDNADKLEENPEAPTKSEQPTVEKKKKGQETLREKMMKRLKASRFRYLNEQLYTTDGDDAKLYFQSDPDAFTAYHEGYKQQLSQWPINPLDVIITSLKNKSPELVVADFGCGDARLAHSIPNKVHSFDLVALSEEVTVCNMAHTPLSSASVDIVVFCLSLMGNNLSAYLREANRVLKEGGLLKIAEVESRFESIESFIQSLEKFGFTNSRKDLSHKLFYFMDFKKEKSISKKMKAKLPEISLKPCLYKKR